jgi:hypothetical protein
MTRCARLILIPVIAAWLGLPLAASAREWTIQGQRVEATLEAVRPDRVVLRQGTTKLEIPLSDLVGADRQFIEPLRRPRVWTNRAGKEISATLIGREEERVILQKDDREVRIAIEQLCDQDRLFISQIFGNSNTGATPAATPATATASGDSTTNVDISPPPALRGERVWQRWNGPGIRGSLLKVRDEIAWFTVGNSTVTVPLAQLKPQERASIQAWQTTLESQVAAAESARAVERAEREAKEQAARLVAEEQERIARQKAAMERAEAEKIAAAERAAREAEERAAQAAAAASPTPAPAYSAPASPAYVPPASTASPVASTNSPMPGYSPIPGSSPMPAYSPPPSVTSTPTYAASPTYTPPNSSMAYSPPPSSSTNSYTSSTSSYDSSDDSSSGGSIRFRPRLKGIVGIVTLVCSFFAFLYRKLSGSEQEQ